MKRNDALEIKGMTHEQRLDLVEKLRCEAGKFLYEYPARLRRTVFEDLLKNKRSTARTKDKADAEELEFLKDR